MKHSEGYFNGVREAQIYYQACPPEGEVKGVLIVVHGLGEHCGRYTNVVKYFNARGYAVYGFDHIGHGRSEGEREYIERFEDYTNNLNTYVKMVKEWQSDKPVFLLGHSLGGLIATYYLIENQRKFKGAVISAPAVTIPPSVTKTTLAFAQILSQITPKLGLQRLDYSSLCSDPQVVQAYVDDPLVYLGKTPARMAHESLEAIKFVRQNAGRITLPFIALQGDADRLADPGSAESLYEMAGSKDKTLKIYPGMYHEIFNEPEHEQVLKDVEDWLEARL